MTEQVSSLVEETDEEEEISRWVSEGGLDRE